MARPTLDTRLVAIAAAMFVTMLWSSSWILIRIGLDEEALPPLTFAGLRYSVAAVILVGWVVSRPAHRTSLRSLPAPLLRRLVLLGVVYFAVTQGAQFVAIDAQPAATSSLMLAPTAFLVALLSGRSIGEGATAQQFGGAILVVVGAVVYFAGDLGATWLGMIASVVGLAANVTGSLLGRSINRDTPVAPVVVTAVSMGIGAVVLLTVGIGVEGLPSVSARSWAVIGWLAIVNTAVAFTLWNAVQRRLAAVETAAINNTMMVQIAVLAWIFLGEAPGAVGLVGILIVSLGAFFASRRSGISRLRTTLQPVTFNTC